jgi:tetratricopeptide (TPR) repeat protein
MKGIQNLAVALFVLVGVTHLGAQVDKIVIPAGTPEDQSLSNISKEDDPQKKLALYQDFVKQYSANPAAVAYGDWQISQAYQATGDMQKALAFGDQALAGSPRNLDILVSQAGIAQQMKDNSKLIDYSVRGGEVYNSIAKTSKPAELSDQDFASQIQQQKDASKGAYEFLEAAAFNAIAEENNAKIRMDYIEKFTPAFPNSRFDESVASYAMIALGDLRDTPRLISYGEKTLATNPNSLPTLLMLANTYADDPKPGNLPKAVSYAEKAVTIAKADAPDADRSRKVSGGLAQSTLGYAHMKQDKTAMAIPELQSACTLLKGQDDQSYAVAGYRLGYAYAKLNKVTEAREVLMDVVKIQGPVQPLAQELLTKVNAARAKGK